MSTITLRLAPETEQKLRERAERAGLTVESLLERLAEQSANEGFEQDYFPTGEPKYITRPRLTAEEFEQKLRELASGPPVPTLPPDFSREDIYYDHD